MLGNCVASSSNGNPQTESLSRRCLRSTDIDFWLSLASTSFKTSSNLAEGLALLLVETNLEIKKFFTELFVAAQGMAAGHSVGSEQNQLSCFQESGNQI